MFREAISDYTSILAINSSDVNSLFRRGCAYDKLAMFEQVGFDAVSPCRREGKGKKGRGFGKPKQETRTIGGAV